MKIAFSNYSYLRKPFFFGLIIIMFFGIGYFTGKYVDENLPTVSLLAKKMPIFYIKKDTPEVCLTFDISWGEKTLPLVLQLLAEYRVPVTFFISGPWAVRHPGELKAIYAKGYEIASHGDKHINLSQYPRETVRDNIKKAQQDLLSVVDRVAPFFARPTGIMMM